MLVGPESLYELMPEDRRGDLATVIAALPPSGFGPLGTRNIVADGRDVEIPYRIYNPPMVDVRLTDGQRQVVNCLYTRHNDGQVRERSVIPLLQAPEAWTAPFIVLLLGEYVVEITAAIQDGLASLDPERLRSAFGPFVAENPELMRVTEQRAISYWSCYYRREYPDMAAYPGLAALRGLSHLTLG